MDAELNGPSDVDWDGFINFPQTPDLSAQSPFNLEQDPGVYHDQQDSVISTGAQSMFDQSLVQPQHLLMPPNPPQPCQILESPAELLSPAFVGSRIHNIVPAGLEEIKARSRTWRSGERANVGLQQVFKSQNFKPKIKRAGLQRDPGKMICVQCKIKKVKCTGFPACSNCQSSNTPNRTFAHVRCTPCDFESFNAFQHHDVDYRKFFTLSRTAGGRKPKSDVATIFYRYFRDTFHGYDLPDHSLNKVRVFYKASALLTGVTGADEIWKCSVGALKTAHTETASARWMFVIAFHLLCQTNHGVLLRSHERIFAQACYSLASNTLFALLDMSLNVREFQRQVTPDMAFSFANLILSIIGYLQIGGQTPFNEAIDHDQARIRETKQYLTCLLQVWIRWTSAEHYERLKHSHSKSWPQAIQFKSNTSPVEECENKAHMTMPNSGDGAHDGNNDHDTNQASKPVTAQTLLKLLDQSVPLAIRYFSDLSSLQFESLAASMKHVMHMRNRLYRHLHLSGIHGFEFSRHLMHAALLCCSAKDRLGEDFELLSYQFFAAGTSHDESWMSPQRWDDFISMWWILFSFLWLEDLLTVDGVLETLIVLVNTSQMGRDGAFWLASSRGSFFILAMRILMRNSNSGNLVGRMPLERIFGFSGYVDQWLSPAGELLALGQVTSDWLSQQLTLVNNQPLTSFQQEVVREFDYL